MPPDPRPAPATTAGSQPPPLIESRPEPAPALPDVPAPVALRLVRQPDGRLAAQQGSAVTPVRPVRCFPWSGPACFISLRDDGDREIALISAPAELDPASRAILEEELAHAGFVLHITRILAVTDELEIRLWKVATRQGLRTLETARDEWPRPLPSGTLLLRDVAGDLYLIPPSADLDAGTRRLLWPFTD